MNPEIDPAMLIRAYVWAVLKANDPATWDETLYGGLEPIVPLIEEPELTEYSGPNIIYVHNHQPAEIPCYYGTMTMMISDTSFRRLSKTMNILLTALDRSDDTARDVNRFTTNSGSPFIGLRFGYIKMSFSEGPAAAEDEGGRNLAVISIEYEYYVNYDVVTEV